MTLPAHILLVEDNEADADLTRETLRAGRTSPRVVAVTDGQEARAYLLREPPYADAPRPDLILLDLNLPGLDGCQLLDELRGWAELRTIPVVILSSSDSERDIARSYEFGANCYLTKPMGLEAYRSVVRAVEEFWLNVAKLP